MAWPPADFSTLPPQAQMEFWKSCHESVKGDTYVRYDKIRALLVKKLTARIAHTRKAEEYSDPKPLKTWENEGWDAKRIEEMGRKVWNTTAGWLYEVPLVRTSRSVTIEDIDERISRAEQQLFQKRKKGADSQEEILMSCSDDEPEPKKRAKQASSDAKDATKAAAAEMRKSMAENAKHNKVTQALATRVVSLITKPVEELKKAHQLVSKHVGDFPQV